MPEQILLPAVTADMTETTIDSWLMEEGSTVSPGDILLEVETDKAVVEVEAKQSGTLAKVLVSAGEVAQVGQCIALLLKDGESAEAIEQFITQQADSSSEPASQEAAPEAPAKPQPQATPQAQENSSRIFSSPVARRLASEAGIDLSSVTGTGPRNRIVKNDVIKAMASAPAAQAAPEKAEPASTAAPQANYDIIPNSGMRKIIAQRLGESKREVPHFYLSVDLKLDALLSMRQELNQRAKEGANFYKLSVNDLVIKASALALRDVPDANASWTDEAIHRYHDVDISIAVATDTGLITPIIRSADRKGLMTLSNEMKSLALKARDGKLQPNEYQGGGFTISNLGMFGIKQFSAIVNPPQSCILAVGAGEQRAVVKDGELAIATVMTCTLSVDHRSVDGAVGARFLSAFKGYIEDPMSMML